MPDYYEYKVIQVRESMIGNKMSSDKLEKLLNEHAAQGWQLKAITAADVRDESGRGPRRAYSSPSSAGEASHPKRLPSQVAPVPTKSSGQSTGGCSPGRLAAHPHPTGPARLRR